MATMVHCDGCTYEEDADLPKSEKRIHEVSLVMVTDERTSIPLPERMDRNDADLCTSCLALMKHTYFKVPMDEKLELAVPTFLMNEDLVEPIMPESLKAPNAEESELRR